MAREPIHARLPDLEHWKSQVKCQIACPVSTDAGRYIQLIAAGCDEQAYLVARSPNPFASICGRVCAAPCEDACRRGAIDEPCSIRALKRTVTEKFGIESVRPGTQDLLRSALVPEGNRTPLHLPIEQAPHPRKKVAVIGAGPAGMAAAHDLALRGYEVTVFEASEEPGGMIRFGIPEYRLPRSVIQAEIDKILSLGVTLRLETALSPSYGLRELRADGFEAIFLGVGVQEGRDLAAPGVNLPGVHKAIDYLLRSNRGVRIELGRRVVVIGGGFVAFDAARTVLRAGSVEEAERLARGLREETDARLKEALDSARAALRSGARDVSIVSLESFDEMPVLRTAQGQEEFEEAKKEGIRFLPRRGPKCFKGTDRLESIELRAVRSVFDQTGRFSPVYDDEDVMTIEADACILAIGQRPDLSFLRPEDGVELTPGGTIKVDRATLATSAPGVFAGGDVAFGPRNLIEAVANGKLAAQSIHLYLSGESPQIEASIEIEQIPTRDYRMIAGFERHDREAPPTLAPRERTSIAEVERGYAEPSARIQGARCLVCHVQTIYDPEECVLCGRCVDVCPEHCLALVPFDDVELMPNERAALESSRLSDGLPLSAMLKDDEKCIRCGLCATRCPTDAMTMERFAITERFVRRPTPNATENSP